MLYEADHHILLLPEAGYWAWVQAIRDYAVKYQVSVTPSSQNAASFHAPGQAISVIVAPGAYGDYDDIVEWLSQNAPGALLDVLNVTTTGHLRQQLASRIESGLRFGDESTLRRPDSHPLKLGWPTRFPSVIEAFGVNPDLYRRWGLPGHDGIDIRAPFNAEVYACAEGEVYLVHDGRDGHRYGIHVGIVHPGGYKTLYAHLNKSLVHTAQVVQAGDIIGLADSTGAAAGNYLHLSLKKEGATVSSLTSFPDDFIDPAPYLTSPAQFQRRHFEPEFWPYERLLVGLNGRVGGSMESSDWFVAQRTRIDTIKMPGSTSDEEVQEAYQVNPDMLILIHLTSPFQGQPMTPDEFAERIRQDLQRHYTAGIRFFEICNEPNTVPEGYGSSWRDGEEFGQWFLEVIGLLRLDFPEARFGFPGLSIGSTTSGLRFDHQTFLNDVEGAMGHVDWIACHCHWMSQSEMYDVSGGLAYQHYLDRWPGKLLLITEFSNPSSTVDPQVKGAQYAEYLQHLQAESEVGGAFMFTVSASVDGYSSEVLRTEDGQVTPIVASVAARSF